MQDSNKKEYPTDTSAQSGPCNGCCGKSEGCGGCSNQSGCTNQSGCGGCSMRGTLYATDWLAEVPTGRDTALVQVLFKNTRSAFYRNTERIPLKIGDWVAVEAAQGHDIGKICMTGPLVRLQMKKYGVTDNEEIKKVLRLASDEDMQRFSLARQREEQTMIRSRQIAAELGLNMKIGDVEYQGDGAKAIFYYIADERVDFRKLIRILADAFKVRIEMKQIGARQEAGRIGGIGPCGRPLCCSSWMTKFVSVGTGAARVQDISMNPQKLAGQCGKLKCCLNFETDTYAEASRQLPHKEVVLQSKDSEHYWFKADILSKRITYSTDKRLAVNLVTIDASRAFEIIELNKQGIKVDNLVPDHEIEEPQREYADLADQDSLTRFDKSKKRRRSGKKATTKTEKEGKKEKETKTAQHTKPESDIRSGKAQHNRQGHPSAKKDGGRENQIKKASPNPKRPQKRGPREPSKTKPQ